MRLMPRHTRPRAKQEQTGTDKDIECDNSWLFPVPQSHIYLLNKVNTNNHNEAYLDHLPSKTQEHCCQEGRK